MGIKKITLFFLLLWLIITYNSEFYNMSLPGIGLGINVVVEGVLLVLCFFSIFKDNSSIYRRWVILLLIYWGLSTTWSANSGAFTSYYKFVLPYILTFALSSTVKNKKDIEVFIKLDLIAVFLCAVYVLLFLDTSNLTEMRLGKDDGENIWNANDIGMKMTVGYAICVYYIIKGAKYKELFYAMSLLFVLVSLMSGSRTVIILLVLFTALLMILRAKGNKKVLYTTYAVIFTTLSYMAVMNIPILYEILGSRIEMMLSGLAGKDGGFSFEERSMMITSGLNYFTYNPWIGSGFNGFSALFYNDTGLITYSHNNYIELLVNTGIIGIIIYYSFIIYILRKLWEPAVYRGDTLSRVLLCYTFIALLCDMSVVSYVMIPVIFRLMYTFRYAELVIIKSYGKESVS